MGGKQRTPDYITRPRPVGRGHGRSRPRSLAYCRDFVPDRPAGLDRSMAGICLTGEPLHCLMTIDTLPEQSWLLKLRFETDCLTQTLAPNAAGPVSKKV